MKQQLGLVKKILLVTVPFLSSTVFITSNAIAATFTLSKGEATFSGFNQPVLGTNSFVDTNTLTNSVDGQVVATANSVATFTEDPAIAQNDSLSQASGNGEIYTGQATSTASNTGSFLVNGEFTFNFKLALELLTTIDFSQREDVGAAGTVSFLIFAGATPDQLSPIDSFILSAALDTPGQRDGWHTDLSDGIHLSNQQISDSFGKNQEFISVMFSGSYQRKFDRPTFVTLVEQTSNLTAVEAVPEPSTSLAIGLSGLMVMAMKRRIRERSTIQED